MALSKKRLEMGEEAWAEYQKERIKRKTTPQQLSKVARRVESWRRQTKERLIEYKGGKCEICGYDKKCPGAYDFHHINPKEKEFGIAQAGKCRKYEDLLKEVDKCQLLCKNCHSEVEEKKHLKSREQSVEEHSKYLDSLLKDKVCQNNMCNKVFKPRSSVQKYCCSECAKKSKRLVKDRPSIIELNKMLEGMSKCEIARQYGVSEAAIRKWLK